MAAIWIFINDNKPLKVTEDRLKNLYLECNPEILYEIEKLAKNEIENLLLANNNNSDRLIKNIQSELNAFTAKRVEIQKLHKEKFGFEINENNYVFHFNISLNPSFADWFQELTEGNSTGRTKHAENRFPRIFKNLDCFLLFESLANDVRQRYLLADYSFIYRRMQKDGYIFPNIPDTEFRDFLQNNFSVELASKTKILAYCKTDQKENNYTTKKRLFQHL